MSDLHDWYAQDAHNDENYHTHYLARHTHYSDADVQANVFFSVMLLWLLLVALFCLLYKFNYNDDRCATSTHATTQIPTARVAHHGYSNTRQYGVQQPLLNIKG